MSVVNEAQPPSSLPPLMPAVSPTWMNRITGLFQRRAVWVLFDQGIVSAGNFIMLLMLGRALAPSEMGAYNILFETILYLNGLQAALIIYPLLVRGATGSAANLGRLATASTILTTCLLPILGGAMAISVDILHNQNKTAEVATVSLQSWGICASAILSLIFWQLQETMRRALMADLRFRDVIWGDALSYLGQALVVFVMAKLGVLDLNRAFIAMGVTSAAAALLQAYQIGLKPIKISELKEVAWDFWTLGRWTLLANSSGIITNVGYNWTLAGTHGTEANGIFAALVYCFKLANPLMASLSGLVTPAVARESVTSNKNATRMALRYILFGASILAVYYLLLIIFAEPLLIRLWGVDKPYWKYPNLLRLFVGNYVAVYLLTMITAWLGGLGQSRYTFYVAMTNVAMSLLVGLPLTAKFGVAGLIWGGFLSASVGAITAIYFIYHLAHLPPTHQQQNHSPGSL